MKSHLYIAACLAAASLVSPAAFAQAGDMQTYVFTNGGSYLGIGGMDITPERAKALNLKDERGVEISSLDASGPAAKAGLKDGDVVLEYNGQPVQGYTQFRRMVQETPVGRQVKISVWRNGAMQTLTVTVGERKNAPMVFGPDSGWNFNLPNMPNMPNMPELPMMEMPHLGTLQNPMLGITGEGLGQEEQFAEFFGVQDGVLVHSVRKGSIADKAGLKAGDVITKVEDTKVGSTSEITRTLRTLRAKKTVGLTVVRGKKEMPLTVTMESAASARQ
jgi:serine protease Do